MISVSSPLKVLAIASTLILCNPQALAQSKAPAPLKSGEQVYLQVCAACHSTGVANAPKFGDKQAWKPLIGEGQAVLTGHAWVGVRAMPAQGGAQDLRIEEFARGVAWIAKNSGGDWNDPDAAMMQSIRKEAIGRLKKELHSKNQMIKDFERANAKR